MSFRTMSWVFEESQAEGTDRLVLLTLAEQMNFHGADTHEWAWPSKARIAQRAKLSTRTVQRSIQNLTELGELISEPYAEWSGRPDRRPNRYRLAALTGSQIDPPLVYGETPSASTGRHPVQERGDTVVSLTISNNPKENHEGLFPSLEAEFERGWKSYPRKVDKGDALKQFKRTVKDHAVEPGLLADTMAKYAAHCERSQTPKEFIKHGKTFFGPKLSWQEFMPENDTTARENYPGGFYEEAGQFFYPDGTEADEDAWMLTRESHAQRNDPNINRWSGVAQ